MSEEVNQDIKKWGQEITKLIQSKNINNYAYTFSVDCGDIIFSSGRGNLATNLILAGCELENALFNYAVANNEENFMEFVDDWIKKLKQHLQQMEEERIKTKNKLGE